MGALKDYSLVTRLAEEWMEAQSEAEARGELAAKPPAYFADREGGFLLWLVVGEASGHDDLDDELSHEEWGWVMEEVAEHGRRMME